MQGFIININKAKDEDLIVTILSKQRVYTAYRFYGARHSTINLGYKIDFELQHSIKSTIPQLRNILHLATKWNIDRDKMYIWQQYIRLFFNHLRDVENISKFYFDLVDESFIFWNKQNHKRVAVQSYIKLLEYEGRLHCNFTCFKCEKRVDKDIALIRGFLPAHKECIHTHSFTMLQMEELFLNKSTLFFDNTELEKLWQIVCEGF